MDRNPLKAEGGQAVAAMVAHNDDIKELHLRYCNLGPAGTKAVSEALHINSPQP